MVTNRQERIIKTLLMRTSNASGQPVDEKGGRVRWSRGFGCVVFLALVWVSATQLSAAENAPAKRFSFVVAGHLRGNDDGVFQPQLEPLLAKVRNLKPDMIFLTGDMIYGGLGKKQQQAEVITRDWERLDSLLSKVNVPVHRVAGNHDIHDPVTRDIYFTRYGKLPRAFTFRRSRFLLLNSSHVPDDLEAPSQRRLANGRQLYLRGKQLDVEQVGFIRQELPADPQHDHVFLFMHHVLWDNDEQAIWWRDVHPVIAGRNVRAVFAGDVGPRKFSHLKRDGIDYIQSSMADIQMQNLRKNLRHRMIAQQFDNFLHVTVEGNNISVDVLTVGALSSGQFTPQFWREMHQTEPPAVESVATRLRNVAREVVQTPRRVAAVALIVGLLFFAGVAVTVWWFHRKSN